MLTAGRITQLVDAGEIAWRGELRGDGLLLRLGACLQTLNSNRSVDLTDQRSIDRLYGDPRTEWGSHDLARGEMVLCQVHQELRLGPRSAGAIGTLSHLARVGLATHVTSPWVLPGWNGSLTLELLNVGPADLRIHQGMAVARLVLFAVDGPASSADAHRFYGEGSHLGSRYADEFPAHDYRR
ncbi:dCTP deaminase domain-containing protein [Saccharothrix isguenensis]